LTALQGEATLINSSVLSTRDDDGIPSQVFYSIVSGPENGFLFLTPEQGSNSEKSAIPLEPVFNFTQEDVDRGRLWFKHRYKYGVKPGIFHFKVSDINSSPIYSSFAVSVIPVILSVKTNSVVRLKQGSSQVTLTPEHLSVESNLPPASSASTQIVYYVVKEPSFGKLLLRGKDLMSSSSSPSSFPFSSPSSSPSSSIYASTARSTFTQHDIDSGLLTFLQLDMSSSHDYFEVDMIKESSFSSRMHNKNRESREQEEDDSRVTGIRVTISVDADILRPKKPFVVVGSGQMAFLTLDHLDASELALRTKSSPIFTIVKRPKYGKLKRLPLSEVLSMRRGIPASASSSSSSLPVSSFLTDMHSSDQDDPSRDLPFEEKERADVASRVRKEDDDVAFADQGVRDSRHESLDAGKDRKMIQSSEDVRRTGQGEEQFPRFSSSYKLNSKGGGHSSLSLVFQTNSPSASALLSLNPSLSESMDQSSSSSQHDPWEVTQFSHEDVVNGVIGYFVSEEVLSSFHPSSFSESILDQMDMTVSAAGVQPGNFKVSFVIMRHASSIPVNPSLKDRSASTTPDPSTSLIQPNDHFSKKRPQDLDNGVNYLNMVITKSHLYIAIGFFIFASCGLLTLMRAFKLFKSEDQAQEVDDISKTKKSSASCISPPVTATIHARGASSVSPVPSSPASSSVSRSHQRSLDSRHHRMHHHQRTLSECSCPRKDIQHYKSNGNKQGQACNSIDNNAHCPLTMNSKQCLMQQHHHSHSRNNTIHRSYHHHQHQTRPSNPGSEVLCENKRCLAGSSPAHCSLYNNGSQNLTPSGSCSPSTTGTDTGIGGCSSSLTEGGDQRDRSTTTRGVNTDMYERNELQDNQLILPPPLDYPADITERNLQEGPLDVYTGNTFGHGIPLTETRFTGRNEDEVLYPLPPPALFFGGNPSEEIEYRKSMIMVSNENERGCFDSPVCDVYGHNIPQHHQDCYNETVLNRSDKRIIQNYEHLQHQQKTSSISRHSTSLQAQWKREDHTQTHLPSSCCSLQTQNHGSSALYPRSSNFCDENQMLVLLTDQDQEHFSYSKNNINCQEEEEMLEIQSPTIEAGNMSRMEHLSSFQSPSHTTSFPSSSSHCSNKSMGTTTTTMTQRDNMNLNVNLSCTLSSPPILNPISISSDHAQHTSHRSVAEVQSSDRSSTMMIDSGNNSTLRRRILLSNGKTGSTERSENSESENTSQVAVDRVTSIVSDSKVTSEEDADAGNISSSTSASPSICLDKRTSRLLPQPKISSHQHKNQECSASPSSLQQMKKRPSGSRRLTTASSLEGGEEEQFWV
jgi:hypothetical protein